MIPREHGAWSMLLTPFFSGVLLARGAGWSLLPATVAIIVMFVLREPLIVLARQRYVWREARPESDVARRWIVWELAVLAAAGVSLLWLWPWQFVIGFGGAAVLLTAAAVWMSVKNRQRSIALQVASAGGLAASSLAACIAATGGIRGATQKKGYLCLESEGAEIHFRNIRIMELPPGMMATGQAAPEWDH